VLCVTFLVKSPLLDSACERLFDQHLILKGRRASHPSMAVSVCSTPLCPKDSTSV
jgi:hypothetical protein